MSCPSLRPLRKTLLSITVANPSTIYPPYRTHPVWNVYRPFSQSSINLKKKKKISFVPPLDEADLIEQFVRGSGPGGQAVNKTNNAVSLIHQPTGIRVQAHTHRSREANRNQARRVLAERVDYFLNRGRSQIEKAWKKQQKMKLAKIRKRKKKEKEEAQREWREKFGAVNDTMVTDGSETRGRKKTIGHKSLVRHPSRSRIPTTPRHPRSGSSPARDSRLVPTTLTNKKIPSPSRNIDYTAQNKTKPSNPSPSRIDDTAQNKKNPC